MSDDRELDVDPATGEGYEHGIVCGECGEFIPSTNATDYLEHLISEHSVGRAHEAVKHLETGEVEKV